MSQQQQQQQQQAVKQNISMQQTSSSFSTQQQRVQQQTHMQTHTVRQVQQGVQRVQGPTQIVSMGLPAGASPPVFEQIFRNARFAQGGDAMFEGKVTGNPKPTVSWMRKGAKIALGTKYQVTHDETTGVVTLLITAIGPGDEGEYTCTAANQYGEAICTVYIQPEAALMMQQQRQQQQSKSFMQQQQMSQQSIIQQQQQQMLSMQNGLVESFRVDTFEYRLLHEVEFRRTLTVHISGEQEVEVGAIQGPPQAPQLQQKPRSTKVTDGDNATFTVKVSGYPSPRVVWFKNGTRLQTSEKHLMTQSAGQVTLVVKQVNTNDNGYYTMMAENSSGCTVASAQLAVVPRGEVTNGAPQPEIIRSERIEQQQAYQEAVDESGEAKNLEPKFLRGPVDLEVQEGKMVRFEARATGRPYPEVTWYINGRQVVDDNTHKVLVNEAGNHSLMISKAALIDAGVITCVARNKSGEATYQCQLNVLERQEMVAPKFVERYQQTSVSEGETVVLQCRAVGTPMPVLSWQKDGVTIENTANVMVQYDTNGASCLQVLSAGVADAGWYQCNAQNSAGSTATRARLHIQTPKAPPAAAPYRPHFPKSGKIIEPEPEPEPEVIILRPVERAHHVPKAPEEEQPEPPKFIHPTRDIDIVEGTRAHFEAKVTPLGDATMNIEWLLDGKPLSASSRATATYRFGFVALDILNVIIADAGVYTCRATNVMGQAETSANLRITDRPLIESQTQHPEAMEQIGYLEDHTRYQRTISMEESSNIKPTFVKPLVNLGEVLEGKYAHFEGQLQPVSDPFMRIEWFKDGKHITASSRINVIYNFGYVALNIMQLREEDSGVYTVRASNKAGECVSQASMKVISLVSVTGDLGIPEQAQHIKSVEEMEAYRQQMLMKTAAEMAEACTAPVFKTDLKDATAREGGYAHFEARLEPIGDPTLKVEWLKDGRPMEASSRITAFFNFGYVALTVKVLIVKDAGTYTCRAINAKGEAKVACHLTVISKADQEESQYEDTVMKMQMLEDSSRYQRTETEDSTAVSMPPKFLGPLKGTNKIVEGQKAHFEIRLEPQSDPTMTVEWYFNGQVIMSASRIKTYHDFGYVSLDISDIRQSDSGQYTVIARNALGQAQMSTVMTIETRAAIDTTTMHEVTLDKTAALERRHQEPHYDIEEFAKTKPEFVQPLQDPKPLPEGKHIHLEARLEPMNDPTMKVEWFCNGKPITIGSRFKTYFDFGFVALDILGVYTTDSGEYTCRAENYLGSAHTSSCVRVQGTGDIQTDTMHDSAMEQIHFLEDASRYQRTAEEQAEINQAPNFIKSLKNIETVEGTNIHLEARLQPVGDSSMRVEWFFNDGPLKVGHRFKPAYDFDYVALDLLSVYPVDSGIYTCKATSSLGQAVTSASVKVTDSAAVVLESQNQNLTMEQLQMLEDRSRYSRSEQVEETTSQTPVFTTSLKNFEVLEGQRAHFEARLIPTSDPTMKVEWFHNNTPVKSGSRFTEYNDFGFVALDIMYAYADDSGNYTCRATNINGQAVTSCNLICHTKDSIVMETMNQEAMKKISYLESSARSQRTTMVEETTMQAPVFTSPIKDQKLSENAPLHFEARLIPVGDPDLKVEWFKNNVPIQHANRISTMHDFGYVALDMKYVKPEDSGTYTCRATNRLGQAVTSATLMVSSKESLLLESQHTEALEKLRYLEDTSRHTKSATEETVITQAPRFVVKLSGLTTLWEGQSAHVECRLEPYPDPTMKVEWFHNGEALQVGHRFRTMYDFGFCAMDILQAVAEDSGTYEVRATNRIGNATSSITIEVKPKSDFIVDTQHPEAMAQITRLEQKAPHKLPEDTVMIEKPHFGRALRNQDHLIEGQAVHMEATLTPVNDPTMKVEWFFNGQPVPSGHRFRTTYDFGFVALDVLYAYPEDSGTYMCKATNVAGQAVTSCSIGVEGTGSMQTDTLDEQRMRKIRQLEAMGQAPEEAKEVVFQKPVFTTPLISVDNLKEGERCHLECRLEPINDPNLKVEWFVNGVEIKAGHRFRTTHDFGYVALDVLYTYGEDSGNYVCKATNKVGEAVNSCSVSVAARRSIYMDTQHPEGWQKIQSLEQRGRYERIEVTEAPLQAPRFTSELRGSTQLAEGQQVHLEGRVEPVHDPSLRIEWYHNGKALQSAARFHTTFDFGYVALDITGVYPEDSGEYTCRAVNHLGEATSVITFKVEGKEAVIYESARPEGLEKIRQLEDSAKLGRQVAEDTRTFQRPVFTQPLQNLDNLTEGETAHFECRLIPVGDPKLKVEWFRNEKPIETSSRINRTHDFGYVALDITGVRPDDEGIYMCRASNDLGEAVTTASIKIKSHATIQLETQHPEGMRKIKALEDRKPDERGPEPEKVYDKPVFTAALDGPAQVMEGQRAHYECRVVPVGDPNMRFEWYCNGVELKMGSRFITNHDFGYVTLDILQCVAEDSGVYMCKAINNAGEAVSSCTTRVIAKGNILGDPLHPGWETIRLRETQWNRVPETPTSPEQLEPPMFTKHLESHERLQEGGTVKLEAQVQPANDPNLSIEWFKNGVQLATGTRIRSTFDFGHVTLDIAGLREDDSGIYTCKAVNRVGEAVSTCTLKVFDRDWLIGESTHPDALPKIAELEQHVTVTKTMIEPTYDVPVFISHLNNVECREGDTAHFECKVEPSRDPTMKIEWFINGKPMQAAARYAATYDFGFVSLDCSHCYAEDSGLYMCRATNSKGSASTTGTLKCLSKANLYFDTQHPQGRAGLEKVEEAERAYWAKYQRQMSEQEVTYPKPFFVVPLQANFSLNENQALHMEANVEPKQDPDLKIEWFLNGKAVEQASRFKTSYDFGLVNLNLNDAYERDQGIYTCRAFNKAGEAFSTSTVVVGSKDALIETTQHPAGDAVLDAIQRIEEKNLRRDDRELGDEEGHPPVFTKPFKNLSNIEEGEIAHFEAMLTPVGDQSMRVEWFFNDEPLKASHRLRTVYAFGMVVLEILGTKIPDSGTYTCRAHNKWGKAECSVILECVDRAHGQPPKFTTHIQSLEGLKDGDSAHYECTLIPIGDPNMKVEWFHNGEPLRNATRIKTVSDFGFVVLDIAYLQNHDAGEWMCKATNKYGSDTTKANLNCFGMGGVYTDSLQPASLDKIAALEGHKTSLKAPTSPSAAEPPKFITLINNIDRCVEGMSAHFEARLKPVNDPNLVVEWYKDGKKLPSGHRYRTFHDFGIVILDILYCYEEDSGVYEARAVNKLGQDKTTATLKCLSKTNLILTPQVPKSMEGGLQKLQNLEDTAWMRRDSVTSERVGMAPKFTVPLSNIDSMKEGENAHFEARLVPTDDPRLKVEWYWNGKPMKYSSRIRQFCDFGFVIMEISPIYPEDSGEYMCRAFNDYGEAVTKATLKCEGKRSIILETQLPKSMQKGMEKIAELEGLMIKSPDLGTPTDTGQPPQFVTKPEDSSIGENGLAHFECRLIPVNDPNLRVEWYHNGRPLSAGSRIKTINDFGFVILEMANCYSKDSGTYTCRAVNKHGEASVEVKLAVSSKSGIILEPQATMKFKDCTQSIQKLEEGMWKKEVVPQEEEKPCPPRFVTELQDIHDLVEGQPAHFDCRVEPVGDSTMRIEWFHNGMPLAAGSRVHMMDDFGFVVLDLEWTFARDTGEYICRATNKWGQATTKAMLNVRFKHGVDLSSQLPQGMTAEKLKELERGPLTEKFDTEADMMPPKFTVPIKNQSLEEGDRAFFEARVEPRNDPNLQVEWFFNGKALQSGHRFRTSFEMGHVTLELLHTYAEDSGEYVCRAYNKLGQDFTKATMKSKASQSVVLQSQVPKGMKGGVDFATQMEETLKKYCQEVMLTAEDIYDVEKRQPPRFVTHIKDVKDLKEMEEHKFDCQLAPVGDPNMKVEWFFNGRPLPFKNRFTPIYDFGYVALIMNWVFGEDSGEYLCRATNLWGMDETRATLKATGRPGVIYDSQIPKGMQSLEKIRELEASMQTTQETIYEEEKPRTKPEVLKKPESLMVQEGDWARFSIRVSGHPRPRVMWIVNGNTAMSGNRFKIWYDGMYHLDIPKTRQYDNGKVEVICRNSLGETYACCELKVNPRQDDYRAVLKNSPKQHTEETSKSYRKPEWVTRMEELKMAMSGEHFKPKFTQEIVDSKVREMETITFTTSFTGNPKPEITWYHNNKIIRQHASYQMRVRNDKAILTIVQARPEMKGEYSCRAVNDDGETFTKARLEIIELTYEEKMSVDDERYAAIQIQHAAEHMKEKERERAVKQKQEHHEAMGRLKDEKGVRSAQRKQELEDAKKNVWKPQFEEKKVKVFKTPKERRVAEVYTNWKSPVVLEERYPEIQPDEFSPNQIPGVKCFVKVSETSVKGEEVVREVAPQFFEEEEVISELARVHTMLKSNVKVNEIWSMFRAGEFKALLQPKIQTALVKICEHIGHHRNVSIVLAQETQEQAKRHPVGLKAFLRMVKHAKNIKPDTIFKDVIPKEMGKFSSTTQELTKVSQMLNQGIETEEIIACCVAGKLPSLKKPETQQPLINIVEKHGHSVMVAQVLVEEAYRDAKDERVLAEKAWESVHEETTTTTTTETIEVSKVKPELPKVDSATLTSVESLQSVSTTQVEVKVLEIAPPFSVKPGDQLRATATYVADNTQENAMHLVEGERVYIQESTNSDWWFVKKHLTLEEGYVPAKLLADEVSYTHYVQQKLEEKANKLPIFDKLKKGQKAMPPKIVSKLEPMIAVDGQEAQFVCKIQGTPRPTVTWFRQTAIIKPSEEFQVFYSDDNTATLVVKEVFPEDAGMFTCVAKNQAGYSSSSAELVVEGPISDHGSESMLASRRSLSRESSVCDIMEGIPPTFANKPSVKTVEEGTQLEMDVRLVAIPEPEIVWKKDGQIVRDSARVRIVKQKDVHAYRSIIIIKGAKKEDEGSYEISVKNREGEAKNHITLRVTAPEGPSFEEKFSDQTVETEGTIRLVARIRGIPAPDVTWSRSGKKLKVEKNVVMTFQDELAVLEIRNVLPKEDSGKYSCTATNKVGKATHAANITVGADIVTFKRGLESCVVDENSEVILECRTSKEKECKWHKGKTVIKSNESMVIEHEGLTHRLIIHAVTVTDTGKYKCTFDEQSTFCNLTVKGLDDFVERIQDVEVQEREEAILQVEVSTEKATVTWHKDGEEITEDNEHFKLVCKGKTRKLVLKQTTLSDEGEYTCVLGDQECTAELTVRELPAEIVKKMKDQVVSKGNRATMEVELTKGDAVITWFKDNKEIRFSDHYQLSIDGKVQRLLVYNCQLEDSGSYRAVVGHSECSATLGVEMQAEGDFSRKLPAQMDVNFKADATFTVEITKDYEVKWLRNGEEVKSSDRYIIKKESMKRILIVKSVVQSDSVEYSCVLANLKTTCKLNVVLMETAPKIDKEYQKMEVVVKKGKDVTLKVPYTATPTPKVLWYFKGQLLNTENNKKVVPTITENEASITIKMVENIDCGEYRVKLSNDCGTAYADITVKLLDKPSQPGTPEPMKVTNDSVTIHWTEPKEDGGRAITNFVIEFMSKIEQTWVVFNKTIKITETTTIVTSLTREEEYCFRVSAVNEVGTSEASNASNYVKVCEPVIAEPPVVKEQLQAVVTGLHEEVTLRCVVTASPAPKIEWNKDGKTVTGVTRYENFTATFTIKETMETSGGMYTCRASNEAGMAECSATVVIQEAPRFEYDEKQQVQRLSVGDKWHVPIQIIGHPRPTIRWTHNDKPLVSTAHIVIHTEESEGSTDIAIHKLAMEDSAVYTITAENSAGKAQLSFNLRVVEEEKEYQVCALEVIEEEVKRERPATPMGPLAASEVSTTSLRLTWKPSPHDGGVEITSYYIEKLESSQRQWQKVAEVSPEIHSVMVQELLEGHEYFFRVFAQSAVGVSDSLEVSETIILKSPFDKPGPPLGPFDVSNVTESSLQLHWDEPEFNGGSAITHYILEKRETTKKAWTKVGQTEAPVTELEIVGLKKGYAYFFRVYAYNAVGQGPPLQPDEPITAGKKITPPSKPNNLQVIDVTTRTVTLAWAPPTTTGGADLMGYVIERRMTSEKKWEVVATVDASVTLYCVENLREKSEYEFRVYAENPVGRSLEPAMTEQVRLKTHATPPSPPTAPLEVRPTGPTSLMIEWGAPESDGGAPLLGYIIAIRDIKRTMWIEVGQVGANFTRLHIKELQEEHEYFIRVFARNEVGASDPLETEEPIKVIRPDGFTELPEDDNAPSLSYSTTETLSWMREAGMDADIYSYARGRLLNRDEYFFKIWHRGIDKLGEK